MKDVKKHEILQQLIKKEITGAQAAKLLGYTQVHISRMKHKLLKLGFQGLLRPRLPSPRRIPDYFKKNIIRIYQRTYFDFNICHFKDKLQEHHNIKLSYETLRQILIQYKIHAPKKKKRVYRRRRRMPKAGLLVQMDSSIHKWLPFIKEKWWLTATIDDATGEILAAQFYPSDGVFNNMDIIRKTIQNKGLFHALYVDKASHFKTTRYQGIHYKCSEEQQETHIERALHDLNINLILANSPQAKGRVERLFGTLQDRLVKELRLDKTKSYSQANKFLLDYFIPYYNNRFALSLAIEPNYKPLPRDTNLDLIFCKKFSRKVNPDNTIQVQGDIIQIPPSKYRISFAKCIVDVCLLKDDRIFVLWKNNLIHTAVLSKNKKLYKLNKKIEALFNQKQYYETVKY